MFWNEVSRNDRVSADRSTLSVITFRLLGSVDAFIHYGNLSTELLCFSKPHVVFKGFNNKCYFAYRLLFIRHFKYAEEEQNRSNILMHLYLWCGIQAGMRKTMNKKMNQMMLYSLRCTGLTNPYMLETVVAAVVQWSSRSFSSACPICSLLSGNRTSLKRFNPGLNVIKAGAPQRWSNHYFIPIRRPTKSILMAVKRALWLAVSIFKMRDYRQS